MTKQLRIPLLRDCRVPWTLRQKALEKIHEAIINKKIDDKSDKFIEEAFKEELRIYESSKNRTIYSSKFASRIIQLRSPSPNTSSNPTNNSITPILPILYEMCHDKENLLKNGYYSPTTTTTAPTQFDSNYLTKCARCSIPFKPFNHYGSENEIPNCRYHWGRKRKLPKGIGRVWSCCHSSLGRSNDSFAEGCSKAKEHVFDGKDLQIPLLHSYATSKEGIPLLAMDAEMAFTPRGMEVCRVSGVDWNENTVIDVFIKLDSVLDYNTRFSGITKETIDSKNRWDGTHQTLKDGSSIISFAELHEKVFPSLIGERTILVGHSLENDLFCLHLSIHPWIIDTSILYPPLFQNVLGTGDYLVKNGLRSLCTEHLGLLIQQGDGEGHDSVEDSIACLKLLKKRLG